MNYHDPNSSPAGETTRESSAPAEHEAGGVLAINLHAIESNHRTLASTVAPSECAAVVKADAYGCGLEPVTTHLWRSGCRTFFVAHLSEARVVRQIAPSAAIYVLSGIMPGAAASFAEVNARPVIGNPAELSEWDAFTATSGWRGGFALHFDTGMNRLGFRPEEALALAPRAAHPEHGIALVMSHLACADDPEHPLNARQIELFRDLRGAFRGIPASLANSFGIFLGPQTHCDMVRPGAALYGLNPTPGRLNPMRPVVELKARILQVNDLKRGDSVGYGATWTALQPARVAIVAVGYADGYMRSGGTTPFGRSAEVLIGDIRCPVVGRVSMDLLAIDVTKVPANRSRRGEFATLIGGEIGVETLATAFETIGYEVLTNLGRRYARTYRQS